MLFNILAEEGGKTNNWTSYILIILVVVVLVGFFVWSAISNKKKQKQFNDTINAIKPGSKVKTIGGFHRRRREHFRSENGRRGQRMLYQIR